MLAALEVNREELVQAFKTIDGCVERGDRTEMVLSFEDGTLAIETQGVRVNAEARGDWPGQLRIPSGVVKSFVRAYPKHDPVHISFQDGRFHYEGFSMACVWDAVPETRIQLPLDAPFKMILSVAYHYSRDTIERSGLATVVADAERARNEYIYSAAVALREFGITHSEIHALVDEKMRATQRP